MYRSPSSSAKIKNKWSNTHPHPLPHIPSWHAQGQFYLDLCLQANARNCLKLGRDCFLPDPLQVSVYHCTIWKEAEVLTVLLHKLYDRKYIQKFIHQVMKWATEPGKCLARQSGDVPTVLVHALLRWGQELSLLFSLLPALVSVSNTHTAWCKTQEHPAINFPSPFRHSWWRNLIKHKQAFPAFCYS